MTSARGECVDRNTTHTPAQRCWWGGILDSPCPSVSPSVLFIRVYNELDITMMLYFQLALTATEMAWPSQLVYVQRVGSAREERFPHVPSLMSTPLMITALTEHVPYIRSITPAVSANQVITTLRSQIGNITHCGLVTPYMAPEILVNIGSGNSLLPESTKPTPVPM